MPLNHALSCFIRFLVVYAEDGISRANKALNTQFVTLPPCLLSLSVGQAWTIVLSKHAVAYCVKSVKVAMCTVGL